MESSQTVSGTWPLQFERHNLTDNLYLIKCVFYNSLKTGETVGTFIINVKQLLIINKSFIFSCLLGTYGTSESETSSSIFYICILALDPSFMKLWLFLYFDDFFF